MNNCIFPIFACGPMIISFSYLIKKTYDENLIKISTKKASIFVKDTEYNHISKPLDSLLSDV